MRQGQVIATKDTDRNDSILKLLSDNDLTRCILMDFPIQIDAIMFGFYIVYFKGSQIDISVRQSKIMRIAFILENSTDPDEMPHSVTFYLGLHCFQRI